MAASITMTASFLGGSTKQLPATRRGIVMAKASKVVSDVAIKEESGSGRRDLVFAVAAAAACSIAKAAMADEPGRGTLEAKKKYAPVCVTMPTARICRK